MGQPTYPESTVVTRASEALVARAIEAADARTRAWTTNVLTTMVALAFAVGPWWARPFGFGEVPIARSVSVMFGAWMAFEVHAALLHTLGSSHVVTKTAYIIDELSRYAAPLALIWYSGSAASVLWVFTLGKSYAFPPSTPKRARIDLVACLAAHALVLIAFALSGRLADAAFSGLVVMAVITFHGTAEARLARQFRVRAERDVLQAELGDSALARDRDRIARELHDGVSADVNALLMRLRELGASGAHPRAIALANRAQLVLDELRGVAWSLRNEQGTLAELGKLVDATCRRARGSLAYSRAANREQSLEHIDARAALTALSTARELVRAVATNGGARFVKLALRVDGALELRVETDVMIEADFSHAEHLLAEGSGTLAVEGTSVVATIPKTA